MTIIAWTGGPMKYSVECTPEMLRLARCLYREQLRDWRDFWEDLPDKETCSIFKNRARHDAYATITRSKS